ncbi:MAG TPA: RNA-binding protein [Blastocatellia bacterium]|nr:RNA-binding protein [Blastocatellia bacterium]
MKIFVSNLSSKVTCDHLKAFLSKYGMVLVIELSQKEVAGQLIGSAIVEMPDAHALTAIAKLSGKALCHRRVYLAKIETDMEKRAGRARGAHA